MADIQTAWNPITGFGDWVLDPAQLSDWLDDNGASITDENGRPIDWSFAPGTGLAQGADLATAVLLSLFTDALAGEGDVVPDGSTDRRGWWGNTVLGSRLWLYDRAKQTGEVLDGIRAAIADALAWLISDGIAAAVDVVTAYPAARVITATVTNLWSDL